MKPVKFSLILLTSLGISFSPAMAQQLPANDSTGLPGDFFSLQGALQLFQKAESPEEFETQLNAEDNQVNNLDLNADGQVDYIRVINKMENDVHVLILQVPVSETENQDIAVIEIEKTGDENAMLQIIGDEEIYGEAMIVEPDGGEEEAAYLDYSSNRKGGPSTEDVFGTNRVIVNVWMWPSVRFMFRPAYRPWVSPWRWQRYPLAFRPWRPYAWNAWYPRRQYYHSRPFVVVTTHRGIRAKRLYSPVRVTSVSVRNRNAVAMNNYKVSRTRTTVTGPRGNTAVRKTTTVRGPGGNVKAKKTTTRRRRG